MCELPKDILVLIGNFIEDDIDLLSFRRAMPLVRDRVRRLSTQWMERTLDLNSAKATVSDSPVAVAAAIADVDGTCVRLGMTQILKHNTAPAPPLRLTATPNGPLISMVVHFAHNPLWTFGVGFISTATCVQLTVPMETIMMFAAAGRPMQRWTFHSVVISPVSCLILENDPDGTILMFDTATKNEKSVILNYTTMSSLEESETFHRNCAAFQRLKADHLLAEDTWYLIIDGKVHSSSKNKEDLVVFMRQNIKASRDWLLQFSGVNRAYVFSAECNSTMGASSVVPKGTQ